MENTLMNNSKLIATTLAVGLMSTVASAETANNLRSAPSSTLEPDRGWHLLGVEGGINQSYYTGVYAVDAEAIPMTTQSLGLNFALNFASNKLEPNQPRWIVSPFVYHSFGGDVTGEQFSTGGAEGRFEHRELGLRVEQERYIDETWSWTFGASASVVEMNNVITNEFNFLEEPQDGWQVGLHVGANARLDDNWSMISRISYNVTELTVQSRCLGETGISGCSLLPPNEDSARGRHDGFDLHVGVRYEF
jgi:hypothetical protein